ncbi:hypothetical protein QQ008_24745 [Fulvivirgaceae bacterium BMA10]|uniref:Thioredoxin domain-containing protein n=1 Tax=Splendidivirga corallicola TaxID=3051826 RepID=A0ABT8KV31_9BACT|nr:hypothetical protein [Fulvivirgaceae bacterium BMA10]
MKITLKILGIAAFFIAIGYVLTYPFELSYSGTNTVKILVESEHFSDLDDLIKRKEFNGKVLYISIAEPFESYFDDGLGPLKELMNHYRHEEIVFVHLSRADSDYGRKNNEIRKWKVGIEAYKLKGYHALMLPDLQKKILKNSLKGFLPMYLIVDKYGNIVDYNAPKPYQKEKLYPKLNELLAL